MAPLVLAREDTPKEAGMANTYNIYKVKPHKLEQLKEKLRTVGLAEQKTHVANSYSKTFYYSEVNPGNDVWWWDTYRTFFKDDLPAPKNIFNFGMLLCQHTAQPETIYAVSLGKSHFYLSKFIQLDFGIDLAIRMADENSILLKKSRYFTGTKRQDVSSYQQFQIDSYEPGESVDHLKLKAADKDIWGKRNIIFADSIQMDMDKAPLELSEIFEQIERSYQDDKIIHLPKLEAVTEELSGELDSVAFESLKRGEGGVAIQEFQVHGVAICFSFHDYDYRISARTEGDTFRKSLGNTLDIASVSGFIQDHAEITNINEISIQFKNEESGAFTKPLKELLDFPISFDGADYFLKGGEWFVFNQTFMDYLKRSLESIDVVVEEDLIEADFQRWKAEKERKIAANEPVDDKLTYREAYFNQKICADRGFVLLDRQLTLIQSLKKKKNQYRVEVADIYKSGEIISVKISETNSELIYNIEQSKDSIELIKRKTIKFDKSVKTASLWFVFEGDIVKITDYNSIQFLLAVESWHKLVKGFGLKPKIYISKHVV